MDKRLIEEKIESLRRCVKRIEDKCPDSVQALAFDPDRQDIIALNLTRAIQLCVDMAAHLIAESDVRPPETMGAAFDLLAETGMLDKALAMRLKKSVGFRNIAVHNYQVIDWAIVHAICKNNIEDFKLFTRHMQTKLGT